MNVLLDKKEKRRVGQATIEYILLFSAVGVVLIVILASGGFFRTTFQNSVTVNNQELMTTAGNFQQYLTRRP